jgi:hypothetical protein
MLLLRIERHSSVHACKRFLALSLERSGWFFGRISSYGLRGGLMINFY